MLCWAILTGERFLYFRDTLLFILPGKWFLKTHFGALWNPYIFMGYPQFAVSGHGNFYPLNLLLMLGEINRVYPVYIFVHFLIALGFMYGFIFQLTRQPLAAFFGALSFSFSGFVVFSAAAHSGFVTLVWLPAILYFLCHPENSNKHLLLAAMCLGLQVLSGELHYCAMSCVVILGFCLATFPLKTALRTFLFLLGSALALGAIQIIPTLEFLPYSTRAQALPLAEATQWSFHPYRLLELILPFPFGSIFPSHLNYSGEKFFSLRFHQPFILTIHFGLFGALFFLLSSKNLLAREFRIWSACGVFFLLLSFGSTTPIFPLFRLFPPLSTIRYPEKFTWIAAFCFVVIASLTFARFAEKKKRTALFVLVLCTIDMLIFSKQVFLSTIHPIHLFKTPWMAHINPHQRLTRFTEFKPRFPLEITADIERDHAITFLNGKENTLVTRGFTYTGGFDGVSLKASENLQTVATSKTSLNESGTIWVLAGFRQEVPEGLKRVYESENLNIALWHNPQAESILSFENQSGQRRPLHYQRPNPDRIVLNDLPAETGKIIFNENHYPGWRANVDGKIRPMAPRKPFGQAIEISGQGKTMEIFFRPWSFILGLILSLFSWLALPIFFFFQKRLGLVQIK